MDSFDVLNLHRKPYDGIKRMTIPTLQMKFDNSTNSSRAPVGKLGFQPPESCSLRGTVSVPKPQQESTDHRFPIPFSLPTCLLLFLAAPKEPVCRTLAGAGGCPFFFVEMAGHLHLPPCLSLSIPGDGAPHWRQGPCLFPCLSGFELRTFSAS